ncbi:hypothetical protein TRFO_03564 [Tritrichomonas foetus]|uniref:Uncharacterized protein n=1 Tax=Tritrichomonas foetus TaxID=1144522 RepID=A0A1J4KMV1_9EUKA|nr:hypothetical protein TRFO_03564 [Tritrichomonas foetus]|eukprot:OHT12563.1 hypothetical protein TRFO_03564 [Tritrichomonas foetus]
MKRSSNQDSLANRVRILERELAEKTALLEKTAKSLADSQKQYQILLEEMERLKFNYSRNNPYNLRSESFNSSSFSENSTSRIDDHHHYKKSMNQLRNVEGNVKSIALQNLSLKTQNETLIYEQQEWNNFACQAFKEIREFVNFSKDFPNDDSEAQRFILLDLIRKMKNRCSSELLDSNLAHKYMMSKLKLKQVQAKCDRMLALLGEKGYDVSPFKKSKHMTKNKQKSYSQKVYSKQMKTHVKERPNNNSMFTDFNESSSCDQAEYEVSNVDIEFSDDDYSFGRIEYKAKVGESGNGYNSSDVDDFKKDVCKLIGVTRNMKGHYRNYAHLVGKDSDIY